MFGPLVRGGAGAVSGYVGRMSTADKIGTAIGALGLGLAADEIAEIAATASKVKCRRKTQTFSHSLRYQGFSRFESRVRHGQSVRHLDSNEENVTCLE